MNTTPPTDITAVEILAAITNGLPPGTPIAEMLRRAADTLDTLRAGATPPPWIETHKSARYGGLVGPAGPETHPSEIAGYGGSLLAESMSGANRAFVCTLGNIAAPVTAWLRESAYYADLRPALDYPTAVAVARAILGEPDEATR